MSEAPPTDAPSIPPALSASQLVLRERARVALALADACAQAELPGAARLDEDAPAQAVGLYRDAVYWSLCAHAPEAAYLDLAAAFEAEIVRLRTFASDDAALDALRSTLVERGPRDTFALPLDAQREEAARAGALAHALLDALDARELRLRRRITRAGLSALGVVALGVAGLFARNALRTDHARDARWHASSAAAGFAREGRGPQARPGPLGVFFHTEQESAPWVELDLGASVSVREVVVENRADCCGERAIPLAVELSADGRAWAEVARRATPFSEWTASLAPRPARYVRLRATGSTMLHLRAVSVH